VARVLAGKTQSQVGKAIGTSAAQVSRIERARVSSVSFRQLVRFGAAVGMQVWMRAYPGGRRVMDGPQLALLHRLREHAQPWTSRTEVTMPIPGDLRAADAMLTNEMCTIVVEGITRLVDYQAQARAALAKKRDLGADRAVLLIADSRNNQKALREAGALINEGSRLAPMQSSAPSMAGEDPGDDGIRRAPDSTKPGRRDRASMRREAEPRRAGVPDRADAWASPRRQAPRR
jgi:transcriptional regulator with XRE-family HTH domain